jgi:hypothetical protein
VGPFQLADLTRPGHRKILALFLVDPNIRITSTENIPPQKYDWLGEDSARNNSSEPAKDYSPTVDFRNHLFQLAEAREWREELMAERKAFVKEQNSALTAKYFSYVSTESK